MYDTFPDEWILFSKQNSKIPHLSPPASCLIRPSTQSISTPSSARFVPRCFCRTYQIYLVNLKSGLSTLQRQQNLSTIIINVLIQLNQALYRLSHCSNQVNCQIKTPLFVAMIRVIFNFSRTRRTRTYVVIRTTVPKSYGT